MALYVCYFACPYIVPTITTGFSIFFAHAFSLSALLLAHRSASQETVPFTHFLLSHIGQQTLYFMILISSLVIPCSFLLGIRPLLVFFRLNHPMCIFCASGLPIHACNNLYNTSFQIANETRHNTLVCCNICKYKFFSFHLAS